MGKPRMVRSDTWAGRKCVAEYWKMKDDLEYQAASAVFSMGHRVSLIFYLKIPDSWSEKKKLRMQNAPHMQKPDIDNLIKAVFDILKKEDCTIHTVQASKIWGKTDQIDICNL